MARQNTRDLILRVAAGLFARSGFRKTTMETIAAAAGRGRRTVYMYFPDKVEIYNAVVDNEILLILSPLRRIADSDGEPKAVLKQYMHSRLEGIISLLKRNPLLVRDFSQRHTRVERLRDKLNSEEVRLIEKLIKRYKESNRLNSASDPSDLAVIFLNMLRGNDRLLTIPGSESKTRELNSLACDVFVDGVFRG